MRLPSPRAPRPRSSRPFAAANLAFSGPGQAAVTALTAPGKAGQEGDGGGNISVVVTVVPLPAETIGSGSAMAQVTSASPFKGIESLAVADLESPPAAGPLAIRYIIGGDDPAGPRMRYEVYNWTTGTWRALPDRRPGYGFIITPLEQDEVNDGLVRFRTSGVFGAATAVLLTSDEAAREG